ncbi:MFS transporter [Kocuria palustris]|uniref:MFS transporter n=1 Tax=Kocuria palustris TaxID=71999 RepID=UPI0019CFCE8B|nr:MFS transporter [Kocuria palustris]MBN6754261.1 MFS transporter [Kocuria palustris]MBN6759193.1 MFS transporter [Kocuria palustris]MBN6764233.1 MFS transporter [Kocuria palustris]MBN6783740.1 MFS transporter [Kocuria palustris]MBN6800222.1 MFS transporter [Kocuria palustris]
MAGFSTVVVVLPVFLVGGLAVQMEEDLRMTAAALGAAVAVFWGVSAVLSTWAGSVAQRLGSRRGMLLSVVVGLVSLLGIGFATPHWGWLFGWLAIAGVANALGHPASNGLLIGQVSARNRAFAFGLKQTAVPTATLVAGISVPLLALTVGWAWTFVIAAGLTVLLLPAIARVVPRDRPAVAPGDSARTSLPPRLKTFLLVTAVAAAMGSAPANALGAFTVVTAVEAGFAPATAGLLLGLGSAAGCLVRPLVGLAADRGIGGSMATVALMLGVGCLGLLAMAWGSPVLFAVGCVLGFGFGWGWNGLVHYVVSHRSHPFTAQATGISQSGTYVGGTAGPLAFGIVLATFGPSAAWTAAAAVAALGAVASLAAFRLERRLPGPAMVASGGDDGRGVPGSGAGAVEKV